MSEGGIIAFYLLILSFIIHSWKDSMILLLFLSALLGFGCFNFPFRSHSRAKVFMGDAGSMLMGLLLVWYLITFSQGSQPATPPVTFLWLAALPLIDMGCVMCRRMLKKQSPLHADREHIHHLLLTLGCSKRQALFVLIILSFLFGGLGLGLNFLGVSQSVMFLLFVATFCGFLLWMSVFWRKIYRVTTLSS